MLIEAKDMEREKERDETWVDENLFGPSYQHCKDCDLFFHKEKHTSKSFWGVEKMSCGVCGKEFRIESQEEKEHRRMKFYKRSCPECHSTLIYVRIKTGEMVCRSCGLIKKIEDRKSVDVLATD